MTSSARDVLKRVLERGLVRTGAWRLGRRLSPAGPAVLAYHNVVPAGEPVVGDRSLHLPAAEFARHLDLLQETHDIVSLSSLRRPPAGPPARPRVAITFDDAYLGAVEEGVGELAARGLPGTVFVSPGMLGRRTFWWDRLADPVAGLDPAVRREALGRLEGRTDAVVAWAREGGLPDRDLPEHASTATEGELRAACGRTALTLASHTLHHVNLAAAALEDRREELDGARRWLADRFSAAPSAWLAYPYGLTADEVDADLEATGYELGFLIDGGALPEGGGLEGFRIPRINVPAGLSPEGLLLRASGWLGG